MMKQYDSYKDSGIEWIGKIPSHWSVFRIRYNYYLKGRIGWQGLKADEFIDEGPYLITGTDFINGKVNWDTCYHISQERYDEAPEIHVKEGDLLITKDGTVGKTAYIDNVPGPSSLNSHLLIIRPFNEKCNNLFLQYVINSQIFDSFMRIFQTGSIMASISQEKFCDFRLPLPSKKEQRSILLYLDDKCGEIDKAIATQEKRVELLKELRQNIITQAVTRGINPDASLKDSGVEWIGAVPEHWEVRKLKNICKSEKYAIKTGPFGSQLKGEELQPDGDVRVYSQRNVIDNNFEDTNFYVSNAKAKDLESFYTQPLDLLVTSRGTIGKCAILPADAPMGILHPCLIAMRVDTNICDIKFVQIYMNESICFGTNVYLNSNATTIEVIYTDTLKNINIPVPPLSEQQEIVSFIETKVARLDKSIEKAEHQIELLQELKQSIITEVVTGKRKVV